MVPPSIIKKWKSRGQDDLSLGHSEIGTQTKEMVFDDLSLMWGQRLFSVKSQTVSI